MSEAPSFLLLFGLISSQFLGLTVGLLRLAAGPLRWMGEGGRMSPVQLSAEVDYGGAGADAMEI